MIKMSSIGIHPIYQLNISLDFLDELKDNFRSVIRSRRRESCINDISDLINVLWKRDLIHRKTSHSILLHRFENEADREILRDYIDQLDRTDYYQVNGINNNLKQTAPWDSPSKFSQSLPDRKQTTQQSEATQNHSNANTQYFNQQKSKIYNRIASEMEWQWKDLGRELELSESMLVNLESQFNKDIKSITHQILLNAEEKYKDDIVIKLCDALSNARRSDLARFVRKEMNIR